MTPTTRATLRGLGLALAADVVTAAAAFFTAKNLGVPVHSPLVTISATTSLLYMLRIQRATYP